MISSLSFAINLNMGLGLPLSARFKDKPSWSNGEAENHDPESCWRSATMLSIFAKLSSRTLAGGNLIPVSFSRATTSSIIPREIEPLDLAVRTQHAGRFGGVRHLRLYVHRKLNVRFRKLWSQVILHVTSPCRLDDEA